MLELEERFCCFSVFSFLISLSQLALVCRCVFPLGDGLPIRCERGVSTASRRGEPAGLATGVSAGQVYPGGYHKDELLDILGVY